MCVCPSFLVALAPFLLHFLTLFLSATAHRVCGAVECIVANAIAFNASGHEVTKMAEDLHNVVKDMAKRLAIDMGREHVIFSTFRNLLATNIAKLYDFERLTLFELMCATCRHSLDLIDNDAVTGVIVDILDFKSFHIIDAQVRSFLMRHLPTTS